MERPPPSSDEWHVIEQILPEQWEEQARVLGAFRRARYLKSPAPLLRLLLLHALGRSLRQSAAEARAASIASMSPVALHLRLKQSGPWLRWIAARLSEGLRPRAGPVPGLRPRVIDSTTIQGPGSTSSEWRIHYALDLFTLQCDWHEVTAATVPECLDRTPVRAGDVLLADRNYFTASGVGAVVKAGGHVLVRARWRHPRLTDLSGEPVEVLGLARRARVGVLSETPVLLAPRGGESIPARVIAIRLPGPVAAQNRKRLGRAASRKQRALDPRSVEAAGFVFLFTTLPAALLDARRVAHLYRCRWQIEIAFKRHKQLLRLGHLPSKDADAAASWILAKLTVALLLETLYRNANALSPWGFEISAPRGVQEHGTAPVEVDRRRD